MRSDVFNTFWFNSNLTRLQGNKFDFVNGRLCGTIDDPTTAYAETHIGVPQLPTPEIKLPPFQAFFERRAIRIGVRNSTIYAQFRTNLRDPFIEKEFVSLTLSTLHGYSGWSTFQGFSGGFTYDGANSYTITGLYNNNMTFEMRFDVNDAKNLLKLSFKLTNPPPRDFGEGASFFFAVSQMLRGAITSNGFEPKCFFASELGENPDSDSAPVITPQQGTFVYSDCQGDLGRFKTELVSDETTSASNFEIRYTYNTQSFNVTLGFEGFATFDDLPVFVSSPRSLSFFSGVLLDDWLSVATGKGRLEEPVHPDNQVRIILSPTTHIG
jgi:hypothetical protein